MMPAVFTASPSLAQWMAWAVSEGLANCSFLTGGCWQVPRGGGLTQQVQSCASENPWAGTRIGVGMENKAVRGFHWCVWTFLGH